MILKTTIVLFVSLKSLSNDHVLVFNHGDVSDYI